MTEKGRGRSGQTQGDKEQGAYLSVGGQHIEEALFPVDLLEDDQTLPSLALVVGLLLVLAEEEESTVGNKAVRTHSMDGRK